MEVGEQVENALPQPFCKERPLHGYRQTSTATRLIMYKNRNVIAPATCAYHSTSLASVTASLPPPSPPLLTANQWIQSLAHGHALAQGLGNKVQQLSVRVAGEQVGSLGSVHD